MGRRTKDQCASEGQQQFISQSIVSHGSEVAGWKLEVGVNCESWVALLDVVTKQCECMQ